MVFNFGAGGLMSWISNARRDDMVKVLAEFQEVLRQPPAIRFRPADIEAWLRERTVKAEQR